MTDRPSLAEPGALLATDTRWAKAWGVCPICGQDFPPGVVVALPVGGTDYGHIPCILQAADGD
jgi:hypothetical protein